MAQLAELIVALFHCYRFCGIACDILLFAVAAIANTWLSSNKSCPSLSFFDSALVTVRLPRLSIRRVIDKWGLHLSLPILQRLHTLDAIGTTLTVAFSGSSGFAISCTVAEVVVHICDSALLRAILESSSGTRSSKSAGSDHIDATKTILAYLKKLFVSQITISIHKTSLLLSQDISSAHNQHLEIKFCAASLTASPTTARVSCTGAGVNLLSREAEGGELGKICLLRLDGDLSGKLSKGMAEISAVFSSWGSHVFERGNEDSDEASGVGEGGGSASVTLDAQLHIVLDTTRPAVVGSAQVNVTSLSAVISAPRLQQALRSLGCSCGSLAASSKTPRADASASVVNTLGDSATRSGMEISGVVWKSVEVTAASISLGLGLGRGSANQCSSMLLELVDMQLTASCPPCPLSPFLFDAAASSLAVRAQSPESPARRPLLEIKEPVARVAWRVVAAGGGVGLAESITALGDTRGDPGERGSEGPWTQERWRRLVEDSVERSLRGDSGASACDVAVAAGRVAVVVTESDIHCCGAAARAMIELLPSAPFGCDRGSRPCALAVYPELASALSGEQALTVFSVTCTLRAILLRCIVADEGGSADINPTRGSSSGDRAEDWCDVVDVRCSADDELSLRLRGIGGCALLASSSPGISARVVTSTRSAAEATAEPRPGDADNGTPLLEVSGVHFSRLCYPSQLFANSAGKGPRAVVGIPSCFSSAGVGAVKAFVDVTTPALLHSLAAGRFCGGLAAPWGGVGAGAADSSARRPPASAPPSSAWHVSAATAALLLSHEGEGVLRLSCQQLQIGRVCFVGGPYIALEQTTGAAVSLQVEDLTLDALGVAYRKLLVSDVSEDHPSRMRFHCTSYGDEPPMVEVEADTLTLIYLHRPPLTMACYWEACCQRLAQRRPPATAGGSSGMARVALLLRRVDAHVPVSSLGGDALALLAGEVRCFLDLPSRCPEQRAAYGLEGPLLRSGVWVGELSAIRAACSFLADECGSTRTWTLPSLASQELAPPCPPYPALHFGAPLLLDCTVSDLVLCSWCNANSIGRHKSIHVGVEIRPPSRPGDAPIVVVPISIGELDWTLAQGQYSSLVLSIFQNFKELLATVPDSFSYPAPKCVDALAADRRLEGSCMGMVAGAELLSSVPIHIDRGSVVAVENEGPYYDLLARSLDERREANADSRLSVPTWAHSNSHRDIAFSLFRDCQSEAQKSDDDVRPEVCRIELGDVFVDIYRRQHGGGFAIDARAASLSVSAGGEPVFLGAGAGAPAVRFLQEEVGNIRQCSVHCSSRIGAYFYEPVELATERMLSLTARVLGAPVETRYSLDFRLSASDCTLLAAESSSGCAVALHGSFECDHIWRGFLQSGPGWSSAALSAKGATAFIAQHAAVCSAAAGGGSAARGHRRVHLVESALELHVTSDSCVRADASVFDDNALKLVPHMALSSSMLRPAEDGAAAASQTTSALLAASGGGSVRFRASPSDLQFLLRVMQQLAQGVEGAALAAAPLQSCRQRLPQLLCDFSDFQHMPIATYYYPHARTSPAIYRGVDCVYSASAVDGLSLILSNGTFESNILRVELLSPTMKYVPSQPTLVAALAAAVSTFNDDAETWEPLVERVDITVDGAASRPVGLVQGDHLSNPSPNPVLDFFVRTSSVEVCAAQSALAGLLAKLSLPDRPSPERLVAPQRPYRLLNRLGAALKASLSLESGGKRQCVAAAEVSPGGAWGADASAGSRELSLSIGFLLNGQVHKSPPHSLANDGTFPLFLEPLSLERSHSGPFLIVRSLPNGSKELLVASGVSISNATDGSIQLLVQRGDECCCADLTPGQEWHLPLSAAVPQAQLYISTRPASTALAPDPAANPPMLVPALSNLVLAGSWERPLRLGADLLASPDQAGSCLLLLPRAACPVRFPRGSGYRPCAVYSQGGRAEPTSMQEPPAPSGAGGGVGGAARELSERLEEIGGLVMPRGERAPLLLQLCPPLLLRSALPQPLLYRLCDRAGAAVAEGVLSAGASAGVYRLAHVLPHGALLISLRMLNYAWSPWTVLLDRDNPYSSGDNTIDIHLPALQLRSGSSTRCPPALDLWLRMRDNVAVVACAYTYFNRSGVDLELAMGGSDDSVPLPALAEGAAELLLRGMCCGAEDLPATAAAPPASALVDEVWATLPCDHLRPVRIGAPRGGLLKDLMIAAGLAAGDGDSAEYIAVYGDWESEAVYSPPPPPEHHADGGLSSSVALLVTRQRVGSADAAGGEETAVFGMVISCDAHAIIEPDSPLASLDLSRGLRFLHPWVLRLLRQSRSLQRSSRGGDGGLLAMLGGGVGPPVFSVRAEAVTGALPVHSERRLLGALGMAGAFRLRASGAAAWGDPVELRRVGQDEPIPVGGLHAAVEMASIASVGSGWLRQDTTHITILPRYLVASRLATAVELRQAPRPGSSGSEVARAVAAGGVVAFDFPEPSLPRLLQLRVVGRGSGEWFGEVDMAKPGIAYCDVSSGDCGLIVMVEKQLLGGALVATLSEQSPLWPPYRLENASRVGVVFSQEGGLGSRQLPPGEARGYYWERPQSSPHLLCLEFDLDGRHAQIATFAMDPPLLSSPLRLLAALPPIESATLTGRVGLRRGKGAIEETSAALNGASLYFFRDRRGLQLLERLPLVCCLPGGGLWLAAVAAAPRKEGLLVAAMSGMGVRGLEATNSPASRDGSFLRILLLLAADSLGLFSGSAEGAPVASTCRATAAVSNQLRLALGGGAAGALAVLHGSSIAWAPLVAALERLSGGLSLDLAGAAMARQLLELRLLLPLEETVAAASEQRLGSEQEEDEELAPPSTGMRRVYSGFNSGFNKAGSALFSGVMASAAGLHSNIVASTSGTFSTSGKGKIDSLRFRLNTSLEAQESLSLDVEPPSFGAGPPLVATPSAGGGDALSMRYRLSITSPPGAADTDLGCSCAEERRNWIGECRMAVEREWLRRVIGQSFDDDEQATELSISTFADGPTRVLRIQSREGDETDGSKPDPNPTLPEECQRLSLDIDSLSVTAIDADLVEICRLSLSDLSVQLATSRAASELCVAAGSVDVISGLLRPCFPVIAAPKDGGSEPPLLLLTARRRHQPARQRRAANPTPNPTGKENQVFYLEECSAWIRPLQMGFEEEAMARAYRFSVALLSALAAYRARVASSSSADGARSVAASDESAEQLMALKPGSSPPQKTVYFGSLRISPIDAVVSVRPSPHFPLTTAEIAWLSLAAQLDSAHVQLAHFAADQWCGSPERLAETLADHFRQSTWREVHRLVSGRQELEIAPPAGMETGHEVGDVGATAAEAVDGSSQLMRSLISGSGVPLFVSSTSAWASNITGGAGRGVSLLTLDAEFFRERSSRRLARQSATVSEGLFLGTRELSKGVAEGISGVMVAPYRGWESGGGMGLGMGVARGLLGAALKPAVGMLDLASRAAEGLRNTSSALPTSAAAYAGMAALRRVRIPRQKGARAGVLPCYDAEAAAAQYLADFLVGFRQELCQPVRCYCAVPASSAGELWGLDRGRAHVVLVAAGRVVLAELRSRQGEAELAASVVWSCPGEAIEEMHSDAKGDLLLLLRVPTAAPAVVSAQLCDYYSLQRLCEQLLGAAAARKQMLHPQEVLFRQSHVGRGSPGNISSMLSSSSALYTYVISGNVLYEYPSASEPYPRRGEGAVAEALLARRVNSFFGSSAAAEVTAEPPMLSSAYPLVDLVVSAATVETASKGYSVTLSSGVEGRPLRLLRREQGLGLGQLWEQRLVQTARQSVKLLLPDQLTALQLREALLARVVTSGSVSDRIDGQADVASSRFTRALRGMSGSLYHNSYTGESAATSAPAPSPACTDNICGEHHHGAAYGKSIDATVVLPLAGLPQLLTDRLKIDIADAISST